MPDLANFLDCLRLMVCKECEDENLHPENEWYEKNQNLKTKIQELEFQLRNSHQKHLEEVYFCIRF